MLITHAIQKHLSVLCIIDISNRHVLMHHLLQRLGYLIHIGLIGYFISLIGIGHRHICLAILNGICLCGQCIARSCCRQLGNCPDITRVKLRYLIWLASLEHIQFIDFFFYILILIVNQIIRLQYTGADLNQRIFANKGIYNGFPDIG